MLCSVSFKVKLYIGQRILTFSSRECFACVLPCLDETSTLYTCLLSQLSESLTKLCFSVVFSKRHTLLIFWVIFWFKEPAANLCAYYNLSINRPAHSHLYFFQGTVMSIVSYFCVFLSLSSLIARANCSSGELLMFYFYAGLFFVRISNTSYIEIVRPDKSLFHEKMFNFV